MSNGQSSPGWIKGYVPSADQWNSEFASKQDANPPVVENTGNFTVSASGTYGYFGNTNATCTMSVLASGITPYRIKNFGTALLTVVADPGDTDVMFIPVSGSTPQASIVLAPGADYDFENFVTQRVWALF